MKLTASYIKKLIKEEYNSLLLEGRIEDLKTRYPPDRVDALAALEINKSTNNKYLEWMLGQDRSVDVAELADAVALFNKNANRLSDKGLPANIGAYKSIEDIKAKISSLGLTKGERDVAAREQTIFHDIGEPLMCFLTPTTTLASQKYGKSTTWCIAAREESDNMFTTYTEDKDSVFYFLYHKDYKPPVGLKKSSDFQTIQQYTDYITQMKASGVDVNKFAIQVMSEEAALAEEYITDEDLDKAYESDDEFYLLKKCTTVWNAINEEIGLNGFKKAVGQKLYDTTTNFIFSKELQKATSVQKAKYFYENAIDNLRYLHVDYGAPSLKSAENFKYDVKRLLELGDFVLYNKLLKIAEPQILPKYREASGIDKMEILPAPEQKYSHLRENKMNLFNKLSPTGSAALESNKQKLVSYLKNLPSHDQVGAIFFSLNKIENMRLSREEIYRDLSERLKVPQDIILCMRAIAGYGFKEEPRQETSKTREAFLKMVAIVKSVYEEKKQQKGLRENKMKLTANYIKKVIVEEYNKLLSEGADPTRYGLTDSGDIKLFNMYLNEPNPDALPVLKTKANVLSAIKKYKDDVTNKKVSI